MKITRKQLRRIIKEASFHSMSPAGKGLAKSIKGKFMRLYPDAAVGIDGRGGFITVNGKKALDMSQATSTRMTDEEMIEKMHAVYAGSQVDADVPTASSSMGVTREGKIRITNRQLKRIIKEATDIVNGDTGEVLTFGDDDRDVAPDAAVPDLVKRLGLNMSPNGTLSNADFDKLEQETLGKQDRRYNKKIFAKSVEDRERLDIDRLLQRLRYWAEDAFKDYAADNPESELQDIAYDLADSWEYEFEADEQEELMWHFDGDLNDLKIYAAESMG